MNDLPERFPELYQDEPEGDARALLIICCLIFVVAVGCGLTLCYGG